MTQSRRALLLAIADYDPADPIPYVHGDLPRMQRALNLMGIPASKIESHGPGIEGSRDLSAARMRTLIQKFLDGAVEGENLIIYFSGHGVEREGHRLLVPTDYDVDYPPPASELVSDVDLFAWSRRSKAASVLLLIDACREGVTFTLAPDTDGTKSLKSKKPAQDAASLREVPTIAIVFSCRSGQFSGGEQNGECSAFTRAFAEALEAEDERGNLIDVIAAAQTRLNGFAIMEQTITLGDLRSPGRMGPAETLIVKASQAAQFRDRLQNSAWVCRIKTLKPWQTVHATAPAIATQVCAIVLRTEDQVGKAAKVLPEQRWRAPDVPFRMLDRINSHLLTRVNVEPAEVAVLLAVPFIYEVALAAAELRLAAEGSVIDPRSDEERTNATRFWRAWRVACLNDQAEQRQIQRLRELGKLECAKDVAMWRLTTFCHRAGELWDPADTATPQSGWVAKEVADAVAPVPLDEVRADTRVGAVLTLHRLLRFAKLMFASFEDVVLDLSERRESRLGQDIHFGEGAEELRLNEVKVVHLLNLGARLALDARRLPSVLSEHLGSDDRLNLEAVQDLLARTEWHVHDNALSLGLTCPHEALDAALRESVDDLDTYHRHIFNRSDQQLRSLAALPVSFNANDLVAERYQGKSRYDSEHLRFALDQRRVMGLLMGKELYGDPDLALRELYQNALDACRYRRAHEAYVRKLQKGAQYGPEYHGQIVFRFGTEEGGRRFIECLDNGIGMADRHLRRLFARAGQRFTDSHEYHLDKARWETEGISFFPNSRFGIGVLSYFMLAEELEVESQRVALPDAPTPERVHARVLGSGSLFRIDREATSAVLGGGTRVRLYLEDKDRSLSDYRESILKWLWLPEFRTILDVDRTAALELSPNEPTPQFENEAGPLLPIPGSEGTTGATRAFWRLRWGDNDRYGCRSYLLADGILTKENSGNEGGKDDALRGIAVNLTEELRPELSVDRQSVLSSEHAANFVRRCIDDGGWRCLRDWRAPDLRLMLQWLASFPLGMTHFSNALRAGDIHFPEMATIHTGTGVTFSSTAGLCDLDPIIFGDELGRASLKWPNFNTKQVVEPWSRLLSGRLSELAHAGLRLPLHADLLARYFGAAKNEALPATICGLFAPWHRLPHMVVRAFGPTAHYGQLLDAELNLPSAEIAAVVQTLTSAGFEFLGLDLVRSWDKFDDQQKRLLSWNLDGKRPFQDAVGVVKLLAAAETLQKPRTAIAELARSLAVHGVRIPDLEVFLNGPALSAEQLNILSWQFDGKCPFVDKLDIGRLLGAAEKLQKSVGEIFEIAQPLGAFAIDVADMRAFIDDPPLSPDQLLILSERLDGKHPYCVALTRAHLLAAVKKLQKCPSEIATLIRPLAARGISVSDIGAIGPMPSVDQFRLLSFNLDGSPPFVDAIGAREFLIGTRKLGLPAGELVDLSRRLGIRPGFMLSEIATADVDITVAEAIRALEPFLPMLPEARKKLSQIKISHATEALLERVRVSNMRETLSCWDLVGAAENLGIPVSRLITELDSLEMFDVDIADCRKFAQFCAEHEGKIAP